MEDLLLLATESDTITTITELVVVWSVCSRRTANQSFLWPQLLMECFTLLPQMFQGVVDYCNWAASETNTVMPPEIEFEIVQHSAALSQYSQNHYIATTN